MNEIQTVEQWLGSDNQIGIDIWNRKYCYNNESFSEWLNRVSGGDTELRRLILEKKFLFGGRALSNRGINDNSSMFNCYSAGYCPDDLNGIMQLNTNLALTYKAQGGQGVSLSKIRPKGTPIGTRYESDGIIPFLELFNQTTATISQGSSRKGALMVSLDIRHKEAEDFIKIKSGENRISKANLSLEIDDEFMNAVKTYYTTGESIVLHEKREYNGHIVEYDIVPIALYQMLVNECYDWADPACLFTNQFRNYNIMEYDDEYEIESCNPCFTGDMQLLTEDGYKSFCSLEGDYPVIVNCDGDLSKSKVWCSGKKETILLKLSNKKIITCTPNHKFMTVDGDECEAQNLKGIKPMPFVYYKNYLQNKYIKLGFIQGDGQLSRLDSKYHDGIEVNIGSKDSDIYDLFSDDEFTIKSDRAIYLQGYRHILNQLGFSHNNLPTRELPSTYNNWSLNEKKSFLQGCYSANGCVIKNTRLAYKTTCKEFADQLVETLKNDFNIESYITTNKSKKVEFNNGEYECRQSYDINIHKYESIHNFAQSINFYQNYKRIKLVQLLNHKAPYVTSIHNNGIQKVYDFTESIRHWGVVEGCVVHNCGEQPLKKNSACNLGSLNLSEFVLNPYTEDSQFNFVDFENAIQISIRALDSLIDENTDNHAIPEQKENSLNYRNIGLGCMGYGTMLFKLGVTYGSPKAKDFTEKLFEIMFRTAVFSSNKLSKEKGKFPKYKDEIWKSEIIYKHFTMKEISLLKEDGLRNCSLISIAPTGSISTMLGVTGGCEPEFAIRYQRKTESLDGQKEKYYEINCKALDEYQFVNQNKNIPIYFVSSSDINWRDRVDTQAIMQKHVDTAISSTVNLPNSITIEDVEKLYIYAWEKRLKGITIYRTGCNRDGILTTEATETTETQQPIGKLKRGDIIQSSDDAIGKKRKLITGCGSLHCLAYFDPSNGDLLETYFSKGSTGGCNNFMTGLSRTISLALRSGCDIYSIIDQLNSCGTCPSYSVRRSTEKDTSSGSCCPVAIGNALLDMYNEIKEEIGIDDIANDITNLPNESNVQKNTIQYTCKECGGKLKFESGCQTCLNCGWSKCD